MPIPIATHSFYASVMHPLTEDLLDCEVGYTMADRGMLGVWREDVGPVLSYVQTPQGEDVLPALDCDTRWELERRAQEDFTDAMDAFRV